MGTITIEKSHYDELLEAREMLNDVAAYDQAITNNEESVPSEFIDRMLNGESILKLWRQHRDLTQQALSNLSGVNRVQIADIESGKRTGSVATLVKLAEALSLTVDDLV